MFSRKCEFWIILGILIVASIPRLLLFQPYLGSWDGAEYSFAIENDHLVHLPYPIFQWIGLLFSLFLPTDIALSLVSLLSGVGSVLLLYFIITKLFNKTCGVFAGLFFALTHNAVYFSTFQENHMLQVFFVFSAIALLLSALKGRIIYSGLLYGISIGVHFHSLVLLPFFIYLIAIYSPRRGLKKYIQWVLSAVIVSGGSWLWILALSPNWGGVREGVNYFLPMLLRNYNQAELAPEGLWAILKRNSIYMATTSNHPGLIPIAFLGGISMILHKRRQFLLWMLFLLPYFIYEILSGEMDPGAHLLFITPAVAILASFFVGNLIQFISKKTRGTILSRVLISLIILVCLSFIFRGTLGKTFLALWEPNFTKRSWVTFEGCSIKDCLWIKENTPEEGRILLREMPWAVPYYTERWPILVYTPRGYQGKAKVNLALNKGRWSPLNYWQVLYDDDLKKLLQSGVEVFALRKEIFSGSTINEKEFCMDFYRSNEGIELYQVRVKNDK
ncbi:glycosyltransferase family 39 protein [bacterium]|nr:glycosyltransferase family 39 protein [bacterium]